MLQKKRVLEIVGSAHVEREEFPELLSAIKETNWPAVVRNKDCHMPYTVDHYCPANALCEAGK